jgi:hypothetical protein
MQNGGAKWGFAPSSRVSLKRLREQVKRLEMEREILRGRRPSSRRAYAGFALIATDKTTYAVHLLCKVLGVKASGD